MKTTVRLTESAIMLAAAFVLSLIPVLQMPFGGSVTLCSMLPILVVSYRHGTKWGLLVGLAGAVLQLFAGLNNLQYATSAKAVIAIILLDYLVAFTALGLGGLFSRSSMPQTASLVSGSLLACAIRYLCHVISGCTVWAGVSIPTEDGLRFSLAYNAAYMIPETIITIAAAVALSMTLDLRSPRPRRAPQSKTHPVSLCLSLIALVFGTIAAIVFVSAVQTEDGFTLTTVLVRQWIIIGVCASLTLILALTSFIVSRRTKTA